MQPHDVSAMRELLCSTPIDRKDPTLRLCNDFTFCGHRFHAGSALAAPRLRALPLPATTLQLRLPPPPVSGAQAVVSCCAADVGSSLLSGPCRLTCSLPGQPEDIHKAVAREQDADFCTVALVVQRAEPLSSDGNAALPQRPLPLPAAAAPQRLRLRPQVLIQFLFDRMPAADSFLITHGKGFAESGQGCTVFRWTVSDVGASQFQCSTR